MLIILLQRTTQIPTPMSITSLNSHSGISGYLIGNSD